MTDRTYDTADIQGLISRLEKELRLCDDLGLSAAGVDLNQAIEKLRILVSDKT